MKLNKNGFKDKLYCWGVNETQWDSSVTFYWGIRKAHNVGDSGILRQMYDEFSFSDFFKARKIIRRMNKKLGERKYYVWCDKREIEEDL